MQPSIFGPQICNYSVVYYLQSTSLCQVNLKQKFQKSPKRHVIGNRAQAIPPHLYMFLMELAVEKTSSVLSKSAYLLNQLWQIILELIFPVPAAAFGQQVSGCLIFVGCYCMCKLFNFQNVEKKCFQMIFSFCYDKLDKIY